MVVLVGGSMDKGIQEYVESQIRFAEQCRRILETDKELEYFLRPVVEAVDKYYASYQTPNAGEDVPVVVKASVIKYFLHDLDKAKSILIGLKQEGWGSDKFWGFQHAGMFIGIEPDGYMHS
jgi:hypothetical protein